MSNTTQQNPWVFGLEEPQFIPVHLLFTGRTSSSWLIKHSNSYIGSLSASRPRVSNLASILSPDPSSCSSRELMITDPRRISSLSGRGCGPLTNGSELRAGDPDQPFCGIRSDPSVVFGDMCTPTATTQSALEHLGSITVTQHPDKVLSDECSRARIMSSLVYDSARREAYIYDEVTRHSTSSLEC